MVVVSVGIEYFKRNFLQEVINGEPDKLVRVLVAMEDAQATYQILRLSAASRLLHMLAQSRLPSYTKLLKIRTLWWSGRRRLP